MAFIGMQHVVAAAIAEETEGSAINYGTNAGFVVGKAIQGNLTWNRNDNPLYADDAIAENDNGVTGGTLELGTDDLIDAVRHKLLGEVEVTVGTGTTATEYETTDDPAPYVGIGYVRVRRHGGTTTYQAVWYHKVQFAETSENAQTKGQSIEWQTPTLTGTIFGVKADAPAGKTSYRRHRDFDTLAAAVSWLDNKAGVTT